MFHIASRRIASAFAFAWPLFLHPSFCTTHLFLNNTVSPSVAYTSASHCFNSSPCAVPSLPGAAPGMHPSLLLLLPPNEPERGSPCTSVSVLFHDGFAPWEAADHCSLRFASPSATVNSVDYLLSTASIGVPSHCVAWSASSPPSPLHCTAPIRRCSRHGARSAAVRPRETGTTHTYTHMQTPDGASEAAC